MKRFLTKVGIKSALRDSISGDIPDSTENILEFVFGFIIISIIIIFVWGIIYTSREEKIRKEKKLQKYREAKESMKNNSEKTPKIGFFKKLYAIFGGDKFDKNGINKITGTKYNKYGFDKNGINRDTGTKYDEYGFDKDGRHKDTGTRDDKYGFDRKGENRNTWTKFDSYGFDRDGINKDTGTKYNKFGFNRDGVNKDTRTKFDKDGFDMDGINKYTGTEYNKYGCDRYGFSYEAISQMRELYERSKK